MPMTEAFPKADHLVGLVVKASASKAADPGFDFSAGIFPGRVIPVTLKIGPQVTTLPGARRYRVSAGTGRQYTVIG